MSDNFGFTDDAGRLDLVARYREAAVADGWSMRPTFGCESIEGAATLEKDGFTMQTIARPPASPGGWYHASINIWGPDRLAVKPPDEYSMEAIRAGLRCCHYCDVTDVDTQRVSFAGRCCAGCVDQQRRVLEQPGWCD